MKRVLIDCDPGIDDALALMIAAKSPDLDLIGVTTVSGNLLADRCAVNARIALELVGASHVPVSAGAMQPLVRSFPKDPFSHGKNGLGDLELGEPLSAPLTTFGPDVIVELAKAHPKKLTIIATGPLTNIALALAKEPTLPEMVSQLIVLGGAYGFHPVSATRATGDNPVSEWNFYVDPEAAALVLSAGFNLFAIGLDVATRDELELQPAHYDLLQAARTAGGQFLLGILHFVRRQSFRPYSALIDSLAVAAAVDPSLFATEQICVAIEKTSPLTLGQSVVDRREHFRWGHLPVIAAASDVAADRFINLIVQTITRY